MLTEQFSYERSPKKYLVLLATEVHLIESGLSTHSRYPYFLSLEVVLLLEYTLCVQYCTPVTELVRLLLLRWKPSHDVHLVIVLLTDKV